MQESVERAIRTMWERYSEPLSLSDLASSAILSRFYFSRMFRSVTGTSPGRFLAAIRLYRAKNLLLSSSSSVTDISYTVGYNSTGTFTSRFTRSVGLPPTRYRILARTGIEPPCVGRPASDSDACVVTGVVNLPATETPSRVYVGAFSGSIIEGMPAAACVADPDGGYRLHGLPRGDWWVLAAAVATAEIDPRPWMRRPLYVGTGTPVAARPGAVIRTDLDMRRSSALDLPILLALPELDSMASPYLEAA